MKNHRFANWFFISLLVCVVSNRVQAENVVEGVVQEAATAVPELTFDSTGYDFGVVTQDTPVSHGFAFKNTGKADLILHSIKTSCGCTAASASTGPFKPGDSGVVESSYNTSGKMGRTQKDIRVYSNDPRSPHVLMLTGTVTEAMHPTRAPGEVLFAGSCAECHSKPAQGKFGKDLYEAVCFMCHDAPQTRGKSAIAADRKALSNLSKSDFKKWTAKGIKGTSMPGFAAKHGGPLSKQQVESLVEYIQSLSK